MHLETLVKLTYSLASITQLGVLRYEFLRKGVIQDTERDELLFNEAHRGMEDRNNGT